jgi:hypothetical protein
MDFRVRSDGNDNMLFVDASANTIGIGTTQMNVVGNNAAGINFLSDGMVGISRAGVPLKINRTAEGGMIELYEAGTPRAQIDINGDRLLLRSSGNTSGLRFDANGYTPFKNGSTANGTVDLGFGSGRFRDVYLSGTIFGEKIALGGSPTANDAVLTLLAAEPAIMFHDTTGGSADAAILTNSGNILFKNGANGNNVSDLTERMRIDNSGNVFIGKTGESGTQDGFQFKQTGECIVGRGSNDTMFIFQDTNNSGTQVGSISMTSSATAYTSGSDYRLKENVDYTWDATARLKQLKPARFNFISDDTNTLVDGFLAHEVSSIVPEAIGGEKDAVDDDGNIKPQGIDQSKLVPLLVKTIQELEARITALEA